MRTQTHIKERPCEDPGQRQLSTSPRERPQGRPALPTPSCWTSSPQNCGKATVWYLLHSASWLRGGDKSPSSSSGLPLYLVCFSVVLPQTPCCLVFPVFKLYINWRMQCIFSCDLLFLFHTLLTFTHADVWCCSACVFTAVDSPSLILDLWWTLGWLISVHKYKHVGAHVQVSLGCVAQSGMYGLQGMYMSSFPAMTIFLNMVVPICTPSSGERVLIAPHPCQHLILSEFLIFTDLVGTR